MNIKLNDSIVFSNKMIVITEKRILGINVYIILVKDTDTNNYYTRTFNEFKFAILAVQKLITDSTVTKYTSVREKYIKENNNTKTIRYN